MKSEEKIAYKQVITILDNMEPEYKEKIPKKLVKIFEENSAENYEFHLDLTRPLKEQELNSKTLALLADNIFQKNNSENKQEEITEEQVALVEHKESVIRKLINKIKSIFHRGESSRF